MDQLNAALALIAPIIVAATGLLVAAAGVIKLLEPSIGKVKAVVERPETGGNVPASSTILHWLHDRLEKARDFDNAYGPQCVDLVNDYLQSVHGLGPVSGNAVDIQRDRITGWRWAPYRPGMIAPVGAVVVWNPTPTLGIGENGHTAVALSGGRTYMLTVDQNWAGAALYRCVGHEYLGVAGWHWKT